MEWDKDGENLAIAQNGNGEVVLYKPVKRFQMKSNGCRDVGLQSTQTRRNTGKQGAQTRATHLTHLPKHPYISGCMIIVGYANQFKVEKNFVVRHAVQPLM